MDEAHKPVMLEEMLVAIEPKDGCEYLDCTFGSGGYSRAILDKALCRVHGIDRDPMIAQYAETFARKYLKRFGITIGNYSEMGTLKKKFDGVVMDVGVSSMQLENSNRGFSFMKNGPLDMRMGNSEITAEEIVNNFNKKKLENIFFILGEERMSRSIAQSIYEYRKKTKFTSTKQLSSLVCKIYNRRYGRSRIHPATKVFQALRIYINNELGEIAQGLMAAENVLKPKGRLVVVTFHSLEDRIVKNFIRSRCKGINLEKRVTFDYVSKKAIKSHYKEIKTNPRARSARLRVATRNTEKSSIDNSFFDNLIFSSVGQTLS